MHASEGTAGFLTDRDARDYAEVIGWAAAQSWCTGAVGLNGVSYLCMSQWRVAALRPPGLKAIVAWEGASDLLREFAYHGGIPETGSYRCGGRTGCSAVVTAGPLWVKTSSSTPDSPVG